MKRTAAKPDKFNKREKESGRKEANERRRDS
jgi:hypothetical protein